MAKLVDVPRQVIIIAALLERRHHIRLAEHINSALRLSLGALGRTLRLKLRLLARRRLLLREPRVLLLLLRRVLLLASGAAAGATRPAAAAGARSGRPWYIALE